MPNNGNDTRVTQLFSFLNIMLKKEQYDSRLLQFNLPVLISFPSVDLIKDSKELFSYFEIFKEVSAITLHFNLKF